MGTDFKKIRQLKDQLKEHHFFLIAQIIAPIIPIKIPGTQIKNAILSAILSFMDSPLPILSRTVIPRNARNRIPMHNPIKIR